jgi:putative ABC transport system permease protein
VAAAGKTIESLRLRIGARPEVAGVVPDAGYIASRRIAVAGAVDPATTPSSIRLDGAAPGYLAMLDVPIVLGRDVALADTAEHDVGVVIGSDLARLLWGNANPIGRILPSPARSESAQDSITMAVIGVYDAKRLATGDKGEIGPVYTAHGKLWRGDVLLIATRGPADSFIPELRRVLRAEAQALPVQSIMTLAQIDAEQRREAVQFASAIAGAGTLALLLASIGLYGVVALAVRQRTREIGIRIAVGAAPARVARKFLLSGVRTGAVALLIGLPVTLAGLGVLSAQGVAPDDVNLWLVGLAVASILLLVATAATWLPARHAARVDPANTLRTD